MLQFLGHLHPVLVHLPIGILLLACLFLWQSRKDRYAHLQPAINIILLLGMISAIAACITGYILSQTGDYDEDAVGLHQLMGISVAVVSAITYFFHRKTSLQKWQLPLTFLLFILIFITGHLGGSLTHGSDYLTQPLQDIFTTDTVASIKRKPIANVQEALIYNDIVRPIFQSKCYSCHGKTKQKGKLRLDDSVMMMKGGKDGVVIIPNKSNESELIKRITLPREDEHHMAPKEKPQLTEQEISLVKWWVDNGTSFSKKVKEIPQPEKIKPILLSLQNNNQERKAPSDVPSADVEKADEASIQKLKDKGVVIIPVAQNNNYISANFITGKSIGDSAINLLLSLKKQLVWLKLSNTLINDSALLIISQCTNLTRLQLDNTNITDKGLGYLKDLKQLQLLNLVGTKVTVPGITQLKDLKNLHSLYLYQTNINKSDWNTLKQTFPKVLLDSGGYNVPLFSDDTVIVKPPTTKK
jgi:uncharacterized membrane protein/mono/diheme cytochrome c family protein